MDSREMDKILQVLWDKDATVWRRHWVPIFEKFARDLVTDAGLARGQIVLDIGTGTGIAAIEALKRVKPGGIVLGIDRSQSILRLAEAEHRNVRNVCFLKMNSERLIFPDRLFDAAISNCGISDVTFRKTISEIVRVLRDGGSLTFNDWRLIDVPVHRVFSEILRRHRTTNPSKKLSAQRLALAELERVGAKFSDSKVQREELRRAGFGNVRFKTRNYRIIMRSVQAYLDMRFSRETLKQELRELSAAQKRALMRDLRAELRRFMRNGRLVVDWSVRFTRATKPRQASILAGEAE